MMKHLLALLFFIFSSSTQAQISLTEFNFKFKEQPKIIILYFYTDWCNICKIQETQIEKNEKILEFLQQDVYFLKFNGESEDPVDFLGQRYIPIQKVKTHPFVIEFISQHEVSYPLWIVLDHNLNVLGKFSGLIQKKNFEKLMFQIKKSNP